MIKIAYVMVAALVVAAGAYAMSPKPPRPGSDYTHLYFCADEQGHVLYIENSRQIDCPGRQEILRVVGNEVEQP